MEFEDKNKAWEEINNLTHIGRSRSEIMQALLERGYDKSLLDEILTDSFTDRLINKEEMFLGIQELAKDKAEEQVKENYP